VPSRAVWASDAIDRTSDGPAIKPVMRRSVDARHRAEPMDTITLSDGEDQEQRSPSRLIVDGWRPLSDHELGRADLVDLLADVDRI
jgi:hypothetical protein